MTIIKKAVNFTKKKGAEMTSPEKIEEMLNRFGQTISDLPKPPTADYAYKRQELGNANIAATQWHGRTNSGSLDTEDFICHQMDVIERLCDALKEANESVEYLRESVEFMMDSAEPFKDQVDTGVYNACSEILEMIDQLFWIREKENDKQRT